MPIERPPHSAAKATRPNRLVPSLAACLLITLAGCALRPNWHWEKRGASEEELTYDQNQCKAKVYSGNGGDVTNETVNRMIACMQAKGWVKAAN